MKVGALSNGRSVSEGDGAIDPASEQRVAPAKLTDSVRSELAMFKKERKLKIKSLRVRDKREAQINLVQLLERDHGAGQHSIRYWIRLIDREISAASRASEIPTSWVGKVGA